MDSKNYSHMNIVFLLRLWPVFGGGETVTRCLANEFIQEGHNVHIIYFKDNIHLPLPYINKKLKTYKIESVKCDQFFYDREACDIVNTIICKYIIDNDITVVINQWLPIDYTKKIKEKTGAKVIKCHHTAFLRPIPPRHGIRGLIKKTLHYYFEYKYRQAAIQEVVQYLPYVDKFVFLSPRYADQFTCLTNNNFNSKITAIPNPLSYTTDIREKDLDCKENIVLIVGRLEESCKRLSSALKVWIEIESHQNFKDWRLCIVGDGKDKKMYEKIVSENNLHRVSFEGYKDPISYYKKSKVFLMTSSFEGFGMTLIEAQQHGVVPVVMDSFLSLHDIIINNRNGLITPDNDLKAYTSALMTLLSDCNLLLGMAKNAIIDSNKFNIKKITTNWIDLINSIEQ